MATLYITEFANIGRDQGQGVPATPLPPVAEQTLAIGARVGAERIVQPGDQLHSRAHRCHLFDRGRR